MFCLEGFFTVWAQTSSTLGEVTSHQCEYRHWTLAFSFLLKWSFVGQGHEGGHNKINVVITPNDPFHCSPDRALSPGLQVTSLYTNQNVIRPDIEVIAFN